MFRGRGRIFLYIGVAACVAVSSSDVQAQGYFLKKDRIEKPAEKSSPKKNIFKSPGLKVERKTKSKVEKVESKARPVSKVFAPEMSRPVLKPQNNTRMTLRPITKAHFMQMNLKQMESCSRAEKIKLARYQKAHDAHKRLAEEKLKQGIRPVVDWEKKAQKNPSLRQLIDVIESGDEEAVEAYFDREDINLETTEEAMALNALAKQDDIFALAAKCGYNFDSDETLQVQSKAYQSAADTVNKSLQMLMMQLFN